MIGLILAALAAATTQSFGPLAPSGKWVVQYEKEMCLGSRAFGPADARTTFVFRPGISIVGGGRELYVLAPESGGGGVRRGQAIVTLIPSGVPTKLDYVSWQPKGTKTRAYRTYADADLIAAMTGSTGLTFAAGKDSFSLATGNVKPVLTALKTCSEDLLRTWGVEPGAEAQPASGASPVTWFPQDIYPAAAKRRGAQGRTVVVVTVSPEGSPTACRVVINADPDLDTTTCRMAMRNSRFEKAPDSLERHAVLAVRWELWDH